MNCEKASLLIEELHDGELAGQVENHVKEHIAACLFCSVKFEEACKLDGLLNRASAAPLPSPLFDQKLMHAFKAKHQREEKRYAWWNRLFSGSINIPKPAFAALSILIAAAFITANIMWKRSASPAIAAAEFSVETAPNLLPPVSPEVIERTKIVEVPVVKEQIVTRVVYVERKSTSAKKNQNQSSVPARNILSKNLPNLPFREANLAAKAPEAVNKYITRVSLDGFQPTEEPKVRVIREETANEK